MNPDIFSELEFPAGGGTRLTQMQASDELKLVLERVYRKGVKLWSEAGQLRYKALSGALTQDEIASLRACKDRIVALLEGSAAVLECEESQVRLAPLSFSQLAHWNLYRLYECNGIRQICAAMRLRGRLNVPVLRHSLAELVRRHEALRTRIRMIDTVPMQEVLPACVCNLESADLSAISPDSYEATVQRMIDAFVVQQVDTAQAPLFGVKLLSLRDDEHVLVAAMAHIISDAVSMGIFLRELFTAYTQLIKGGEICLPPIAVQFPDFAAWQRNTYDAWETKHGRYWDDRLSGCGRLRFPVDGELQSDAQLGWDIVPVTIPSNLKMQLRQWSRQLQTTLVFAMLTVYVALVLHWCGRREGVVQYQTDGRASPQLENTIGYVAAILYLRIELSDADTFVSLLQRVQQEYCKAFEHRDFSSIEARVPRPDFAGNSGFNWIHQGGAQDLSGLDASPDALECSPVRFKYPNLKNMDRDNEPAILLFDLDEEILGHIYYPRRRFAVATMQRFARNLLVFTQRLAADPNVCIAGMQLVE